MASLDVNGVEYEVVGGVTHSTQAFQRTPLPGGGFKETPMVCYIQALIRIGSGQSSIFDPPSEVRLDLPDGRGVYGSGMVDVGDGAVHGDVRRVRFEGASVEVV